MHAFAVDLIYVHVADVVATGDYESFAESLVATIRRGHVSGVLLDLEGVRALDERALKGVLSIAVAPMLQGIETRVAGCSLELAEKLSS